MVECLIRYYFNSDDRMIRFERKAKFPAVPFIGSHIGSHLSLKADHLRVEDVIFCEKEPPVLLVATKKFADPDAKKLIADMKRLGWELVSDTTIGSRKT